MSERGIMRKRRIHAEEAYYIKLGKGGDWASGCLRSRTLRLGYNEATHEACHRGDWAEAHRVMLEVRGGNQGPATSDVRQIRTFYESGPDVLWITFHGDRLYWCFSKRKITLAANGTRTRPVIGRWRCGDLEGKPLNTARLSGALLRLQRFQGTICSVRERDYLLRRINAEIAPEVDRAAEAARQLEAHVEALVRLLCWEDFELLVDLIFRGAGCRRVSVLGKSQKAIDLDLRNPLTDERFLVQVKSKSDLHGFRAFQEQVASFGEFDRAYFVVHTPAPNLNQAPLESDVEIWRLKDIAKRVVAYGLTDWLIDKAA